MSEFEKVIDNSQFVLNSDIKKFEENIKRIETNEKNKPIINSKLINEIINKTLR